MSKPFKIKSYTNKNGKRVHEKVYYTDVEIAEQEEQARIQLEEKQKQERIADIKSALSRVDLATMRPLRAIQTDTATQDDHDRLAELEAQAQALRSELEELSE